MGFTLKVLEGPEKGKSYSFDRVEITLGRTMDNDVVLPDPGISRQHLSIRDKGGAYILKDLGSSNGTQLNGKPVKEEVLQTGDVISLGGVKMRFAGTEVGSDEVSASSSNPDKPRSKPDRIRKRLEARRRLAAASIESVPSRPPRQDRRPSEGAPLVRSAGLRSPGGSTESELVTSPLPKGGPAVAPSSTRAKRGAAASLARLRQNRPRVFWTLVVALICVLAILVVLVIRGGKKIVQVTVDHSDEEFVPGQKDDRGNPLIFGNGSQVNMFCREKVTFRFKYIGGRVLVRYAVGEIQSGQEVALQLNGVFIDYAPIATSRWSDEKELLLPRKHLIENNVNRLAFVNTINSAERGKDEKWMVYLARLEETPLPQPDPRAAEEAYQNCRERYKVKNVAPESLYQAMEYCKAARDFLELVPQESRPFLYNEAVDMIGRIDVELDKRYGDYRFEAEKAKKFNDLKRAKEIFHLCMQSFPNQEDPRFGNCRNWYNKLP